MSTQGNCHQRVEAVLADFFTDLELSDHQNASIMRRAADAVLDAVAATTHPLTEQRRCGARLAKLVDPPPGPVSPPIWCALPDDGHDRHRTYDGRWLDLFSRSIEDRPPVITYRCEVCRKGGRTPADACDLRAAIIPGPKED